MACAVLGVAPSVPSQGASDAYAYFEQKIRPLLVARCYGCHSVEAGKNKGGLVLDSKEGWESGGQSGPVLVPGDPEKSRLILAVRYTNEELKMPPPGRLPDQEIRELETWVRMGAPDPRTKDAPKAATGRPIDWDEARKFWAFRPPETTTPPEVRKAAWCRNEIDHFVLARLEAQGLEPSPEADRHTLLRRLSFDLIGLPPSAEEIDAYLADAAPDAFEKQVDRLLASPHYGERWGRFWLDLARYADSNGVDENLALANGWRYRDWVIRSLNEDKPYGRFLIEQIAGDLLPPPDDPAKQFDPWIATGFLVLGPKMLAEQDKEKLVMDVVDEQLDVLCQTTMGLTVGCARCHDHKYDPITQRDYYALAGIFKSTSTMAHLEHVSHWRERELAPPEKVAETRAWKKAFDEAQASVKKLTEVAGRTTQDHWRRELASYLLAGTEASRTALFIEAEEPSRGNLIRDVDHWGTPETPIARTGDPAHRPQFAEYDLTFAAGGHLELWIRYAAKESRPVRVLVNGLPAAAEALKEATGDWFPKDQRWFSAGSFAFQPGRNVLRLERDGPVPHLDKLLCAPAPAAGVPSEWPRQVPGAQGLVPGVVRAWADLLVRAERQGHPILGLWIALARLDARDWPAVAAERWAALRADRDADRFLASPLLSALLDAPPPPSLTELAARYQAVFSVVDQAVHKRRGDKPAHEVRLDDPDQDALARLLHGEQSPFNLPPGHAEPFYPEAARTALAERRREIEELNARKPPPFDMALAVIEGTPADLAVHIRGSHLSLEPTPVPRGVPKLFEPFVTLPEIPPGSSGRLELATWLTHPDHPLTARVMMNRLWLGHFGQGLVRTPSNFGTRGEAPTHPELLDWLARAFVQRKWSLKAMHRLIVTSSTWRMSAGSNDVAKAKEPDNRLLWRQNRRRLDAEALRDAILLASGTLDRTPGGSLLGVGNFDYVTNDQSADKARYAAPRRTIYLPVIRNAMADVFTLFDFPDSSVHLEQRPSSIVPGQALWFLNSPFVREQAARIARDLLTSQRTGNGIDVPSLVKVAWRKMLGRAASEIEARKVETFLSHARSLAASPAAGAPTGASDGPRPDSDETAWTALCQALLASNEFVYIE